MKAKTRLHKAIWDNPELRQNYTRPEIMRNVENYGVFIDEKLTTNRLEWVLPMQKILLNNWPKRETAPLEKIRILKETENYLIIFKPLGVPVQPGSGHETDNLLTWLLEKHPEQKEMMNLAPDNSNAKTVAGIVHRLDKNTQGILLVAENLEWHEKLQNEFRNRNVEKYYLAKVWGKVHEKIEIEGWQARDKKNPIRQKFFLNEKEAKNYDENSRFASSVVEPIFYCENLDQSLVKVQIKTGRMHQIRVACEFLGFPLVADHIYNIENKNGFEEWKKLQNLKSKKQVTSATSDFKNLNVEDWEEETMKIFGAGSGEFKDFGLLANEIRLKNLGIEYRIINL